MFIPNPLPPGPYYAYVFKVRGRSRFKIGFSTKPHRRIRDVQIRRLRLTEYCKWQFDNYFAALYVEQQIIAYLKRFEFASLWGSDDWFDIDEPTMKVVIEIATDLAKQIKSWEQANWELDCMPRPGTPYHERMIADIEEQTRQARAHREARRAARRAA